MAAGSGNLIQWLVVLGIVYIVVVKTNILQTFTQKLGQVGQQTVQQAQAQPESYPETSITPATLKARLPAVKPGTNFFTQNPLPKAAKVKAPRSS